MAHASEIEWTESTWNPVTGCSKISPGCKNCYAERMALRLQAMGQANYRNGFEVTLQPHMLELPLRWRKPQRIFVNSMSDLFHKRVPLSYIQQVFAVMRAAHWHEFQVLTKRAERSHHLAAVLEWPSNVWMGVSVESSACLGRIDGLRATGAAVRFLSLEPLLGAIPSLDLTGIHWVIAGGESGPRARAVRPEWVADLRDQCRVAGVAFFFKQWGGRNKKKAAGCSRDEHGTSSLWSPALRPRSRDCLSAHQESAFRRAAGTRGTPRTTVSSASGPVLRPGIRRKRS